MEEIEIKSETEEDESLLVQVSPNKVFLKQVFGQSLNEDLEDEFSPNASTSAQSLGERPKAMWLYKDCQLLINLYKEEYPNLGKKVEVRTKRKLWEHIAERMAEHGSYFTSYQVEGKWKSLWRSFRNERTTCPYERELSDVLVNRPSVMPSYQLGSTIKSGKRKGDTLMEEGFSFSAELTRESAESDTNPLEEKGLDQPPKRLKVSTMAEELIKLRKEFAEERKSRNEYRKAKLEAYKERTAVLRDFLNKTTANYSFISIVSVLN